MDVQVDYGEINEYTSLKDKLREEDPWEVLTRVELDVAYSSEKALNLEMFLIQVEDIASDYASLSKENEDLSIKIVGLSFEFDILSGILNSEVKELDQFVSSLQVNIVDVMNSEDFSAEINEKLQNAEKSLEKTQDVVTDIRKRSSKFENDLAVAGYGTHTSLDLEIGIDQHSSTNAKWKEEKEQQRHFLQMLEKSLARELDLEKKLFESKHNEENLQLKLQYAEQELYSLQESIEMMHQRIFEAENASEALLGISKELSGKLQIVQFNLKGTVLRETEVNDIQALALRDKVKELEEHLRESDAQLVLAKASAEASREQQNVLNIELQGLENTIEGLKEDVLRLESRAESAEEKCAFLTKTNFELNGQLSFLNNHGTDKANSLERKLKESDMQLEHAKTSIEAIEEQQNMLCSALSDMENLIEDLKGKVSKAESRAENAEAKCTLLTETNLELNDELGYLKSRLESVEASLNQADDAKISAAKDIGIRTKFITDLVMKLAFERERLQAQISLLAKQNRFLAQKGLKTKDSSPNNTNQKEANSENNFSVPKSSEETLIGSAATATSVKVVKSVAAVPSFEETNILTESSSDAAAKLETVRTIEAAQLSFKYLFMAVLILLVSIAAIYLFQLEN